MTNKYWVSFGSGHYPWGNCYSIVEAESEHEARKEIVEHIAGRWCTTYSDPKDLGIEKYGVRFVPWETIKSNPPRSSYENKFTPITDEERKRCRAIVM